MVVERRRDKIEKQEAEVRKKAGVDPTFIRDAWPCLRLIPSLAPEERVADEEEAHRAHRLRVACEWQEAQDDAEVLIAEEVLRRQAIKRQQRQLVTPVRALQAGIRAQLDRKRVAQLHLDLDQKIAARVEKLSAERTMVQNRNEQDVLELQASIYKGGRGCQMRPRDGRDMGEFEQASRAEGKFQQTTHVRQSPAYQYIIDDFKDLKTWFALSLADSYIILLIYLLI
jgi:cytochrome c biogenesis protein ResB